MVCYTTRVTSDYLERIRGLYSNSEGLRAVERDLARGVRLLSKRSRTEFRPSARRAFGCVARSVVVVVIGLAIGHRALSLGWWWLAIASVYLAGLGFYGLFVVFHDAVHGSVARRRGVDALVGRTIAALLLLDYDEFQRSHLEHHRHSQSGRDPKRLGIPDIVPDAELLFGPVDGYPALLRVWANAGNRLLNQTRFVRLAFYLVSWLVVAPFFVLIAAAEFSVIRRRWSEPGRWLSAAASVALYAFIFALSPSLAFLLLAATLASYAFVFLGFITHVGPNQLYSQESIFSRSIAALNVSDLRIGPLFRFFGHGFSENHAAHHLMPHVPVYALTPVTRWLDESFAAVKAPGIQFGPRSILAIADAMIAFGTRPYGEGWMRWRTDAGDLFQRCARSLGPTSEPGARASS